MSTTGWKLVPVEPTEEMIRSASQAAFGWPVDWARHYRAMLTASPEPASPADDVAGLEDDSPMVKISKVIADLSSIKERFGDTCVYIRRGDMSWGAVALNRRADDETHGVFELQAQHDRDMLERLGQIERLIASKTELAAALSRLQASLAEVTAELTTTEQLRHEENRRACSETEKRWASDASAATMREALTKIAAPYDGEGDTLLVPLQKIGTELRKRQQIARAALGGQHG